MTWSTMGNSHKSDPNPKLPFRSQPHESPEFHNIGQDISVIEHDGIHKLESIAHDSGCRPNGLLTQTPWASVGQKYQDKTTLAS